jgi:dihydrolipoamide dehydrogenase
MGVHIIGAHATELIAEATLCPRSLNPTLPEIMAETAFKALNRPVHG